MVTPTLTGATTLGKLQTERMIKKAGLLILPFPLSADTSVEASGFNGANTEITISGIIVVTPNNVNTTITNIRSLADPNPSSTRTYTSDSFGGVSVVVLDIDTDYRVGDANRLHYTIRMNIVGSII